MGILEGKITGERAKMMLETYEMQFDAPYYVVAMLYADTNPKEVRGKTVQLLTLSLKDMAQDYLNERLRFYSAIYLDEVILVFMVQDRDSMEAVLYHLDQVCKMGTRVLNVPVTASVGQVCDQLDF